ncbi:MAG: threonylcarbamoyl-AMP synthase [candidate division Zixibacteria bacterium]|nr:threonylcarbamoyl-AMP synthase [candidate division Zixibacteria bacterium]
MPVLSKIMPIIVPQAKAESLDRAVSVLESDGLVVAPTETRYGLLASAISATAVARLFEVKGRAHNMPTALFVRGIDDMERYGSVTPSARRLIARFLPGPLTLVLTAVVDWGAPRVVDGKIGFRWSSSPFIASLLDRTAGPLTATSANRSGRPDPESIEEIAAIFGEGIDLYIDGGALTGPTSTVVECVGESVRILREGAISAAEIEESIRS